MRLQVAVVLLWHILQMGQGTPLFSVAHRIRFACLDTNYLFSGLYVRFS